MNRSIYSLVLMDSVVEAVDQLAAQMHTSRSNLINQILAEHVSMMTPEKRTKDIFSCMEAMMEPRTAFQIQSRPGDAMLSVRSSLQYKYKPTIRYSVKLYRDAAPMAGALRVSLRTQSEALLDALQTFFQGWMQLEDRQVADRFPAGQVFAVMEDGKYNREFIWPEPTEQPDPQTVAQAIAEYIQVFDDCMKTYFACLQEPRQAWRDIQRRYAQYCAQAPAVL